MHQGGPRTIFAAALAITATAALAGCGRHDASSGARVATAEPRDASSESAYEVAVAQAEGAHRVAVERCGAMSGDAGLACLERADADLERARTAARHARDAGTTRR